MNKIILIIIIAILYNGCASNTPKSTISLKPSVDLKMEKQIKYANSIGCKMQNNGYMICPKSMNK